MKKIAILMILFSLALAESIEVKVKSQIKKASTWKDFKTPHDEKRMIHWNEYTDTPIKLLTTDAYSYQHPRPGYWSGNHSSSFTVTSDNKVRNFDITIPFHNTTCQITALEDIPIVADTFFIEAEATLLRVDGRFSSDTTLIGTYSVSFCDGILILEPSTGAWTASWKYNDVSVVTDNSAPPHQFLLAQNYPNPFNSSTTISYQIPQGISGSPVKIKIFNVNGQLVKTLVDGTHELGFYSVTWDGRDDRGKKVASGIYFYRLTTATFTTTKRLLILK